MKVGTDAVILGAWVNVEGVNRILDVGTGCGIIALMLSQRTANDVMIEGIEVEPIDAAQAQKNVTNSPWANRVLIHPVALQDFQAPPQFDLIVSNPPYFINSQLPPTAHRAKARHTQSLSFEELITHSLRLLNSNGRLAIILPSEEGNLFQSLAEQHGLFPNRRLAFYSRQGKPQERWLIEFSKSNLPIKDEQLILHGEGETWSEDYQNLTRAFYLKL
ncbi:MAG: methyltransferase [Cyclobacteriaceae bacterium]|nr:methyltransferase [Cyclobacteriaceae bacterium]